MGINSRKCVWRNWRFSRKFDWVFFRVFFDLKISLIKITFQFKNVTFIELRWRMTRRDGKRYRGAGKTTMTVERFRSPTRYATRWKFITYFVGDTKFIFICTQIYSIQKHYFSISNKKKFKNELLGNYQNGEIINWIGMYVYPLIRENMIIHLKRWIL